MKLVHSSKYYSLYQPVGERCFYVDFGQKTVRMSLCQLLSLRQKVFDISIEDHFDSDLNRHGFEVLMLCNKEHLFILNTLEVLDLKELIDQGFVALGLAAAKNVVPA
ncbi:hypothetical protein GTQ34_08820 [Muricauda sp. JGD-17]|uniref:Uncharacterized protein n=1 Tax=Flagellimonas ochracea TaxID=2696472 RepID=A0A964WXG0_9FLAO|nr:hypothetical protein [Allomuricauda ochracea]NAY92020.1 hypothetical protein [Allomuricauda ochracea]